MAVFTAHKEFALSVAGLADYERIVAIQNYLRSIPDEAERGVAQDYLLTFSAGDDAPATVVVLLHGIRTAAQWQDRLAHLLRVEHQLIAHPLKFGVFVLPRFLVPAWRRKALELVRRHFDDIREIHPGARVAVVAHSFGTYLFAQILLRCEVNLDRVLLCGSIVKQDYDWGRALAKNRIVNIVNDVGTKDWLPVLAHATAYDCGPSGYLGFGSPWVVDRFHALPHSGFFEEPTHIPRYWIPFLVEGIVVPSDHTLDRPKLNCLTQITCGLPNMAAWWVLLAAIVSIVLAILVLI